jgi:hypothetical protein
MLELVSKALEEMTQVWQSQEPLTCKDLVLERGLVLCPFTPQHHAR